MEQKQTTATNLEMAHALGFQTVAEMEDHQRWLEKHGTPEYRAWLASIPVAGDPAQTEKIKNLVAIDAVAAYLRKRWKKKGSPACAVELFFFEVEAYRNGTLAGDTPQGVLQEGVDLLETWIADGKPAKAREREVIRHAHVRLAALCDAETLRIASLLIGDDEGVLDDLVHDEFSALATGINNDGAQAQVKYLVSNGWTEAMLLEKVRPEKQPAEVTATQEGSV